MLEKSKIFLEILIKNLKLFVFPYNTKKVI